MRIYPQTAPQQLEFDKIKSLVVERCQSLYAKEKAEALRIHTKKEIIELELRQSFQFRNLLGAGTYFPNDYILNLRQELQLLSIEGSVLSGEEIVELRKLLSLSEKIYRWFDAERQEGYDALYAVISNSHYEKTIAALIDDVIDESGIVKDSASPELAAIRMGIYRKRNELRRLFEKIVSKLNKQGYLAEIEESFLNGRKVVAVVAEQKRVVKGILHGESDSRRTAFIEPEETIELNNQLYELESNERKEVYRLLRELTARLRMYTSLLQQYHNIVGEFDFIRAKAALALSMHAEYPAVEDKAFIHLVDAQHPLLLLYNQKSGKPTIPLTLQLGGDQRILVISGPNAGGKTVSMKTAGLLQMMVQSGLLVPVHPSSRFGIFKQLMIHIGDEQSIEFELSTYSSHLLSMKQFMEGANGRTLFFIDELGSGSDPALGGAFAEVIMEELARKHAIGIVTTHYLNLKVMAGKTTGIVNGAMLFDEKTLMPLYKLVVGKPGSSYTFAIAERIGLDRRLIDRARQLVDADHFRLDKLLNRTEQDLQQVQQKERDLHRLLKENERLKKDLEHTLNKEKHTQQVELLKQQNRLTEERLIYLKDMERKLKQVVLDWRKEEDKDKVVKSLGALLFHKPEKAVISKKQKQLDSKYEELSGDIAVGDRVKMKRNLQVGEVLELRGRKAVVKIGLLPMQVDLVDLVKIRHKVED